MLHQHPLEGHVVQLAVQQFHLFVEHDLLDHQHQFMEVQELVVQHAPELDESGE